MNKKLKILVTNDDGIHAPGLKYLCEALQGIAKLYIIAPASQKSGVGLGITMHQPIEIQPIEWMEGMTAWKVSGTPADCVKMGLSVVLQSPPDLIVSGINRGDNSGRNVLYSGTIGGVIEGVLRNVPGIAFSCADYANPNYPITKQWIGDLVSYILEHPMPKGTLLNVNFPSSEIRGLKFARQGRGYWMENLDHRIHPEGHSYYWLGGQWRTESEHEESDVYLLKKGYAAAVPIHIDELTDLKHFQERKSHFDQFFESRERLQIN